MKKQYYIISLVCLLLLGMYSPEANAQKRGAINNPRYDQKKIHFGFYVGANQMHFSLKMKDNFQSMRFLQEDIPEFSADSAFLQNVRIEPQMGFSIGVLADARLGKYFNLRFTPELLFGQRSIRYDILTYHDSTAVWIDNYQKRIPSTHLNVPLLLKYKAKRMHNIRPYVFVGLKLVFDLASQKDKKEDNENYVVMKLVRNDVAFETGVGCDFYFDWFKLGTELKMSYGLKNLMDAKQTNIYNAPISSLYSRVLQLVVTFE